MTKNQHAHSKAKRRIKCSKLKMFKKMKTCRTRDSKIHNGNVDICLVSASVKASMMAEMRETYICLDYVGDVLCGCCTCKAGQLFSHCDCTLSRVGPMTG